MRWVCPARRARILASQVLRKRPQMLETCQWQISTSCFSQRRLSGRTLKLSVSADQVVCRTVVREGRFGRALHFGDDALSQNFAELHASLVERIDMPDRALGKHGMFVQSDKFAEGLGREPSGEDRVRRTVAFEHAMRDEPIRRALGFDLLRRFAESQRFGLGENVCQKHVMVPAKRIERLREGDKVTRDEARTLMD